MDSDQSFTDLIQRVRAGETDALGELVRRYAPEVRIAVRALLTDPGLRTHFDSVDIVQSVLHRFCTQASQGQVQLESPAQLVALLNQMAYHKFVDRYRHEGAQVRDYRRTEGRDEALRELSRVQPGPSTVVGWRDEYREIRRRLTEAERILADRWARGESWVDIGGPDRTEQDRLRHQLDLAFARVVRQLTQLQHEEVSPDYLRAVYRWVVEQAPAATEVDHDLPPHGPRC